MWATIPARFHGDDIVLASDSPRLVSMLKSLRIPFHANSKGFIQVRPLDFPKILENCETIGIQVTLRPPLEMDLRTRVMPSFSLHDYQQEAIDAWHDAGHRGVVVLPTGAGKSFVGLQAIVNMNYRTLIVVPTLALVDQWIARLSYNLGVVTEEIGQLGGGKQEIKEITVGTYDSAALYVKKWRTMVGLIVFDEVHHLVGKAYRIISEGSPAPARLGLTATLPDDKNARRILLDLVGPLVKEYRPSQLRKSGAIADYEVRTIEVPLTEEQRQEYDNLIAPFRKYLAEKKLGRNPFQKMIYRVNQDPEARRALKAYQNARLYAFNLPSKIKIVEELLEKHLKQGDQILIFSESVSFVEKLSRTLLIPMIVNHTSSSEREWLLENFKKGTIRVLASGKVLDEGIDVPSANVGIIISGSGQKRQFIQRLGRLLRKKRDDKPAILYDIVTKDSTEERLAKRRKRALR